MLLLQLNFPMGIEKVDHNDSDNDSNSDKWEGYKEKQWGYSGGIWILA